MAQLADERSFRADSEHEVPLCFAALYIVLEAYTLISLWNGPKL